ncbi:MAG TPA: hypothetical protein EYH45_05770 [Candidatus Caldiarchaeum subterraneum]|uniref:NarG-like domain-containing protein n=1 Tax=Caldiarchaeum subterraneum TaxID=311458 RepID=A0A832ZWB2_CALS0|nr:hypothetical protein [Candidatus Caldarchaeum subterraneum]
MNRSLYNLLTWGSTAAVTLLLIAMWINLYIIHSSGNVVQIDRNTIISKNIVDAAGITALIIVIIGVVTRIRKKNVAIMVQEIMQEIRNYESKAANGGGKAAINWPAVKTVLRVGIYEVLLLGKLGRCEDFQQWLSHFMIMWGFIGLGITTTLDAIVNFDAVPLPLLHPVRILGNVSGIIFMAGLTLAITRRLFSPDVFSTTTKSDWAFLIAMYGTGATGFLVQWYADLANYLGTAVSYIIHLIFVAVLLVTAPWTKFIHALWRPSWIIYSRLLALRGK